MLMLGKAVEQQEMLIKELIAGDEIDRDGLISRLTLVRGTMSMVQSQMKDVQLLFPSTKSKTKNIDVKTVIEKVHNLYKRAFKENRITVEYSLSTQPLVVKTTDAVLLQVFINLFDNSLYWLKTVNDERKILITIDGSQQRMIFSDSGPGIKSDDIDWKKIRNNHCVCRRQESTKVPIRYPSSKKIQSNEGQAYRKDFAALYYTNTAELCKSYRA